MSQISIKEKELLPETLFTGQIIWREQFMMCRTMILLRHNLRPARECSNYYAFLVFAYLLIKFFNYFLSVFSIKQDSLKIASPKISRN